MTSAHRRLAYLLVPLALVPWQRARGQAPPPASAVASYPAKVPAGDKTLSGVVVDEQNKPVAGLIVGLTWRWSLTTEGMTQSGSMTAGFTATDASGRFQFTGLPAGEFEYEVGSATDRYVRIQAPLTLANADTQKAVHVVAAVGSLVTGKVVDGLTGKPVAGIFVGAGAIPTGGDLAKWEGWEMPSSAVTDASGQYRVRVLPGNVFVGVGRITTNTLLTRRVHDAAERVTAASGQTASAPDLPVFLHPILVCLGPDGQPVAGTPFRILPKDLAKTGYTQEVRTDDTGTVVLTQDTGFEGGLFSIEKDGQAASGTYDTTPEGALTLTMNGQTKSYPSGAATIHLSTGSAGIVTGTVVSQNKPLTGARVSIWEMDPSGHTVVGTQVFKTDAAGKFRAPLDPNGEYTVYVRADGFNQVSVSDKPLFVTKGRAVDLGTVRLVHARGFVTGRVVDKLGHPMAGVLVYVRGGQTFLSGAVTDDAGHFRIRNVVIGDVVHLKLCLKGESPDSGEALSQSNEEMDLPDVTASGEEREIVWNPHS